MRPFLLSLVAAVFAVGGVFGSGASLSAGEEYVVGTNAEFPPFEYFDKENQVVGFDIDLVKAVGEAAGFKVKILHQAFDTLVEQLDGGKLDIVAAGMTITEDRKKRIDFSEPYFNAAQVIVVRDGTEGFTKIEDIKGKRVSVQLGTTGATMAEEAMGKNNRNLKQFRKFSEAFAELKLGRVDCVVVDLPVAKNYVSQLDGIFISSPPMEDESFGLGIAKGRDELLAKVNKGLAAIRESGEYDRLIAKWFGQDAVETPEAEPEAQAAPDEEGAKGAKNEKAAE